MIVTASWGSCVCEQVYTLRIAYRQDSALYKLIWGVLLYVCVAKQKTVMPMQWSKVWYCAVWHCKVYLCYNRQTGRQWHPCSGVRCDIVRCDIVRYVCVTTGKPEDSDAHAVEQGSQCRVHHRHSLAAAQRWIHHQKPGCESGDGWSCSGSDCTPLFLLFSLSGGWGVVASHTHVGDFHLWCCDLAFTLMCHLCLADR